MPVLALSFDPGICGLSMRRSLIAAVCAFTTASLSCGGGTSSPPPVRDGPRVKAVQVSGANSNLAPGQTQTGTIEDTSF